MAHRCRSLLCLLLLPALAAAPRTALADKELKRKFKQTFKDIGEVGKHIAKKTRDKTVKVVHKLDKKLGGGDKEGDSK